MAASIVIKIIQRRDGWGGMDAEGPANAVPLAIPLRHRDDHPGNAATLAAVSH